MANTKLVRVPMPRPGDGYKILRGRDGRMTTVPMSGAELALYATDRMAMDAMPVGGPKGSPDYASYNADVDPDTDGGDPGSDLTEKVRELLAGKLDPADLDALCALIDPDSETAPMPVAQDCRRQARDQMPSMATMQRLVAQGAANRAQRVMDEIAALGERFPALKNARVVG